MPRIIVTDNAKEFVSQNFKDWVIENKIMHHLTTPESHQSNGRIERVIRTIRDGLMKCNTVDIYQKIKEVEETYNNCYHVGIKCTPSEALNDISGIAAHLNSAEGPYIKQFVKNKREKFYKGQQVRVAKKENLGKKEKNEKGRFVRRGVIKEEGENDSYIVLLDDGRIVKKRHYELKGMAVV